MVFFLYGIESDVLQMDEITRPPLTPRLGIQNWHNSTFFQLPYLDYRQALDRSSLSGLISRPTGWKGTSRNGTVGVPFLWSGRIVA